MKDGIKTNFDITIGNVAAAALSAAAHDSTVIDMQKYETAAFVFQGGDMGSSATLAGKLQCSHDNSTWVDDDGTSGNSAAVSLGAGVEGTKTLYVVQPLRRYYKAVWTVGAATAVACTFEVAGPKLNVEPSS